MGQKTISHAPKGRYQVIIEVFDHQTETRIYQSEQCIAAVSPIQAIRRGGMKLVQKLTRDAEKEIFERARR